MLSPWRSETYWIVWLTFVGLFVAKITGQFLLALNLCVLVYFARHLFHLHRLLVWLRGGGKLPVGSGIWEEIYYLIYRIRRRNKNRKRRLLRILEQYRTATAALPDATVVLGSRDQIDWFNDASERLLGLQKNDVGRQITNLIRFPKFAQYLRESDHLQTLCIPSPVLERVHLEIRVIPYGGSLRLLVAQDVSQLRFMEKVRTDFVANVSHELRTPLTVLKGYMEALSEGDAALPEPYVKIFRRMEEQTLRMQSLIDGLLSLTRLESTQVTHHRLVAVPGLLTQICDELSLLEDDRARLELTLESSMGLSGVETELRSAFTNLIVNALKYTPLDGHVKVIWRTDANGARLEVRDNGPGIAEEHLDRLTERFYRVEAGPGPRKNGAGLGLAIVKHVLTRHDAELKIQSVLGKGSCFACHFPAKRLVNLI